MDVKTNLLYQLEGTESIISVDYTFEERIRFPDGGRRGGQEEYGTDVVWCAVRSSGHYGVSGRKRGFYCLDASGAEKLILDGNGNSELEHFLPYKAVGYVPGNEIETEQLNRRERTGVSLRRGAYMFLFLPALRDRGGGRLPDTI